MASLLGLSVELKLAIIEQLDHDATSFIPASSPDLLSLSKVCRVFRTIALPYLFKDITLLNDEKSGTSVSSVVKSVYAEHVRTVHYIGVMPMAPDPSFDREDAIREPAPGDLPNSVADVLSNLAKLSNLGRLIVEFRCAMTEEEEEEIYRESYNICEEPEHSKQVLKAERTHAFRSLANRSYEAIAQNSGSTIKHLELRNIVAKRCSVWESPAFHDLLSGLSRFTISLRGGDNGAGWQINMVPAYLAFIEQLDKYFFSHMAGLKQLRISTTTDGPPGLADGMNNVAIPLKDQDLTSLEVLELEHVFVSTDLASFITSHASSLKKIRLVHCYSGMDENNCVPEVGISWGEFFSTITSADLSNLQSFDIGPSDQETRQPPKDGESDFYEVGRAIELREKFSGRRMLDYKHVDDKYGMLFDSDLTFERFEEGTDHACWEQLRAALGGSAQVGS